MAPSICRWNPRSIRRRKISVDDQRPGVRSETREYRESRVRPMLKSKVCHSSSEGIRMPETIALAANPPLTTLTDDEILFRDNVRQFAEERVRPLAKEMDEKGVFEKDLIHQFFQLGLMGIEVPEQYGGGGGRFFEAILAVEELSRADASAGVVVDVQNTLVKHALLRWTTQAQRQRE